MLLLLEKLQMNLSSLPSWQEKKFATKNWKWFLWILCVHVLHVVRKYQKVFPSCFCSLTTTPVVLTDQHTVCTITAPQSLWSKLSKLFSLPVLVLQWTKPNVTCVCITMMLSWSHFVISGTSCLWQHVWNPSLLSFFCWFVVYWNVIY